MRTYRAVLTAEFRIEAENIMQARHAARRIRALGEVAGIRRGKHERDATRFVVDRIREQVKVAREGGQ